MKVDFNRTELRKFAVGTVILLLGFFLGVVFSSLHYEFSSKVTVSAAETVSFGKDVDVDSLREYFVLKESESTADTDNMKININTADINELILLPGIGEKTAVLIVEYRTENGNFESVEDIMSVKRISEKLFEKIKDLICV